MGWSHGPFLAEVLALPHSALVRAVLKNSVRYQRPPSAWFGRAGEWTDRDHLLTIAYTLYEATLCGDCGRPVDECRRDSYRVETRICRATAAVEQYRKTNKNPPPGTVLTAVKVDENGPSPTIASAPDWWKAKHGFNPDGSPKER